MAAGPVIAAAATGLQAAATTGRGDASQRAWFLVSIALVALARLWALYADPSAMMPDATVMDEGLWADSARGRVMFPGSDAVGDLQGYFADDLGNSYLIAPLYTWLLTAVYWLFGIGLWQTRLLAALMSIGTAALAGSFVARRSSYGYGTLCVLLLGACPLLDQHGRFALMESTQAFWLLLSFSLLFPLRRSLPKALLAGAAMGAAMLVKPNSLNYGVVPFSIAFGVSWYYEALSAAAGTHLRRLREGLAVMVGGAAVIGLLGLPVWLAYWHEFVLTVSFESGGANWFLSDHLLRLGLFGARESVPGHQQLSALVRHAPLITAAVWLLLVRRVLQRPWQLIAGERELWIWSFTALLMTETGYDHAARRHVLYAAPLAVLAVQCWRHRRDEALRSPAAAAPPFRPARRYLGWLLLLAPLLLIFKPVLANALAGGLAPPAGAAGHLAGQWVLAGALALPLLPALLGARPQPWLAAAARYGTLMLPVLFAYEVLQLGALPPRAFTIRSAQQQLQALTAADEIVLGQHASVMFMSARMHTVRRVKPGQHYSSARPNADVAERLRPRYVLDYADPELQEFADVTRTGFVSIGRVGYLREPSGSYRFALELWERR